MTNPYNLEPPQPKPLRVIAAVTGVLTLIIGGLPTFGVPLSAEQASWLVGVVGALAAVAVALLGEQEVTPVSSPRDNDGNRLVPQKPPELAP